MGGGALWARSSQTQFLSGGDTNLQWTQGPQILMGVRARWKLMTDGQMPSGGGRSLAQFLEQQGGCHFFLGFWAVFHVCFVN